jgi:hypothetical protein
MKATEVSKVLIDKANDRVTLGLTGEDGDTEITVPLARIPTLAASLIYDGEPSSYPRSPFGTCWRSSRSSPRAHRRPAPAGKNRRPRHRARAELTAT